jgi:hypothetical protein
MLQATLRRAATLVIALATLTACDAEPLAPHTETPALVSAVTTAGSANTIYRDDATVPYSFVVYTSCANGGQGEVLQVSGQLQYRVHGVTSTNGERNHYAAIETFTGSAVGWDSGEAYDVTTRELHQGNTDYGADGILDSGEELQRIHLDLTSRATGAVIQLVLTGGYVRTAAGEFVLDRWDAAERCG